MKVEFTFEEVEDALKRLLPEHIRLVYSEATEKKSEFWSLKTTNHGDHNFSLGDILIQRHSEKNGIVIGLTVLLNPTDWTNQLKSFFRSFKRTFGLIRKITVREM